MLTVCLVNPLFLLMTLASTVQAGGFMEEVSPPDLSQVESRISETWRTPGSPHTVFKEERPLAPLLALRPVKQLPIEFPQTNGKSRVTASTVGRQTEQFPLTLQQQVKHERGFGDFFLPGMKSVRNNKQSNFLKSSANGNRLTRQSNSSGVDGGLVENGSSRGSNSGQQQGKDFGFGQDSIEPLIVDNYGDDDVFNLLDQPVTTTMSSVKVTVDVLTPTSVVVADDTPPRSLTKSHGDKCEYVQMKGGTLGDHCMKGGMSCERKCNFETSEPECEQVTSTVCEDVPREECLMVVEKSCKTVQEEVCDTPDSPAAARQKCEVVLEEVCQEVLEPECRNTTRMVCNTLNKEACTTMKEQVCRPTGDQNCVTEVEEKCNLVQDVICRNITENRFEEKCWTVEEEVCRTVYDTVWEPKCEMVNITVPQKDCQVKEEFIMEQSCKIINDTVKTPVCVTVTDQIAEEDCEDVRSSDACYEETCSTIQVPVLKKQCRDVTSEMCEVIIEQGMEQKCQDVEQTEYSEECSTSTEQECVPSQEYVCEEPTVEEPLSSYGAPLAPVLGPKSVEESLPTYSSSQGRRPREHPYESRWKRKKILSKTPIPKETKSIIKRDVINNEEDGSTESATSDSSITEQSTIKDFTTEESISLVMGIPVEVSQSTVESKDSTEIEVDEDGDEEEESVTDISLTTKTIQVEGRTLSNRKIDESEDDGLFSLDLKDLDLASTEGDTKVFERSANFYTQHPRFEGIGGLFQKLGNSQFQSNFYGGPPSTTTPRPVFTTTTPAKTCRYVTKQTCTDKPKTTCKQVPKTTKKNVCIDYPVSIPRQECNQTPRQECDIVEEMKSEEKCQLNQKAKSTQKSCKYNLKKENREECKDVELVMPRQVCTTLPKSVQKVECDTRMKAIELKEICVDIDIQLPREECKKEEREDCRYQPIKETVQRCEPTVREECKSEAVEKCSDKCTETCEDQEKRICMTIPQQECDERVEEKCDMVARQECKTLPREECNDVESKEVKVGECRTNTRLECVDQPREKCGRTFTSECREEPHQKCNDRKTENCEMACEAVYWCKMC